MPISKNPIIYQFLSYDYMASLYIIIITYCLTSLFIFTSCNTVLKVKVSSQNSQFVQLSPFK